MDERNIVTSYRQISYSEHEEGPGHIAHTKEDDGDITVTVATTRRSGGEDEKKQVKLPPRPALPPFLYFRWPFTYVSQLSAPAPHRFLKGMGRLS